MRANRERWVGKGEGELEGAEDGGGRRQGTSEDKLIDSAEGQGRKSLEILPDFKAKKHFTNEALPNLGHKEDSSAPLTQEG